MNKKLKTEFYRTSKLAGISAQKLKIKSGKEYKLRYKEDPRLPSNPNRHYSNEWTSWKVFLGTGITPYETFSEASKAAINIGVSSGSDYMRKRHVDPKLPSRPETKFKDSWNGWNHFLGKNCTGFYESLNEASQAVFGLGIHSQVQYHKRYKEDPKLCSSPHTYYADEWVNWYTFLCKERCSYYESMKDASNAAISIGIKTVREYNKLFKKDPLLNYAPNKYYEDEWVSWSHFLKTEIVKYKNLRAASEAAIGLDIKSAKEYMARYKEDPLLPACPSIYYKDEWKGFAYYLGVEYKYASIQEASDAAIRLGIKSRAEYRKRFREDTLLHGSPQKKYRENWIDWYSFLQVDKPLAMDKKWIEAKNKYLEDRHSVDVRGYILEGFYSHYFKDEHPPKLPSLLFYKDYDFNSAKYISFISSQNKNSKKRYHNVISEFFDYIIDEYCTDKDNNGDAYIIPGFRNPLKTILKGFGSVLASHRPSESVKPVLPFVYIDKARTFLFSDVSKSFSELNHLHDLFSADWFDVDLKKIDKSDPDCVWRVKSSVENEEYQMWSPARAVALFTLLMVPLRGQQILWLDSGEADSSIPFTDEDGNIRWKKNANILSNLRKDNKGFIEDLSEGGLGMFVTTNKTSHTQGCYSVPYIPHNLALLIIKLRNWQSKYNPLNELTSWTGIKLPRKINIKTLQARGKQAFLFRDPCSDKVSPYSTGRAFGVYLPRVLYKIQDDKFPLVEYIGESRYKSKFTPHSLRVSLITAYVVDGGVSLQVVAKLVGHASIVMTIYYIKIGSGEMRRELGEAEKRAIIKGTQKLEDTILSNHIEQARGELVGRDNDFFSKVDDAWPVSSYQFSDKGICPMGGGACDSGGVGEIDRLPTPTPTGYLGRRNCIRCRYFITGPAFIGGLQALANEISLEIKVVNDENIICQERIQELEDVQYDCDVSGEYFTKKSELSKAHSDHEERAMKLDLLLCDMSALLTLIKQCMALLNEQDAGNGKQLIVSDSLANLDFLLEESQTSFRLLSQVCENATIYTGSSASRALPLRSQMLDQLADKNGLSPTMFRLSKEQQLTVGNQLTKLLMDRVQSWVDIDRLVTGDILLDDLNDDDSLEPLSQSIKCLLDQPSQNSYLGGS